MTQIPWKVGKRALSWPDHIEPESREQIVDLLKMPFIFDRVLAQHYGLTDEELDFIINYDIKYRMGRGG